MTTVEDIMIASPSLRERAKAAHAEAQREEKERHEREQAELLDAARTFLADEFNVLMDDLRDIEFLVQPRENNFPVTRFRYGGIWFRASYAKETTNIFTHMKTDEVVFRLQVCKAMTITPATSWIKIETLADLGAAII